MRVTLFRSKARPTLNTVRDRRLPATRTENLDLSGTIRHTTSSSSPISDWPIFFQGVFTPNCHRSLVKPSSPRASSRPVLLFYFPYPIPPPTHSMQRFLHLTLVFPTRQQQVSFPAWHPSPPSNCRGSLQCDRNARIDYFFRPPAGCFGTSWTSKGPC